LKELTLFPEPLPEDMSQFPPRPPVVTIMGHVDHGKTTLLDYLRKSSIVATEHGGITQHIGAFTVEMSSGKVITFLDTPGHAAFLSMRERGATVTDIIILVVAADDSVMPQTLEAIKHARAADVPMIVALNKVDKGDANVQRVKQDLARHGVEVEDFGGDVQAIPVSGKTGQGMDLLEEAVVTLSEILDHRAPPEGKVEGWVLESATKKAGKVATVLVRRGTLRPGDIIVAGRTYARVRSLRNEAGVAISEAGPGTPVEVDGWRGQPAAGDEVLQAPDEQKASKVIEYREAQHERIGLASDMEAINESRKLEQQKREREEALEKLKADGVEVPTDGIDATEEITSARSKKVYFIVKGDVSGSIEAVINAVSAIGNNEIQPHVLRSGVGPVTQFDIEHASAAKGHVIAFNTTVDRGLAVQAEKAGVKIVDQSIIYRLTEDVTGLLTDALPPVIVQRVVGEAEIAQEFRITIKGKKQLPVAGCKIRNGVVARTSKVKVLRGGVVVFDGMFYSITYMFSNDANWSNRFIELPQKSKEGCD
jgi:translation initiation factor IF-2